MFISELLAKSGKLWLKPDRWHHFLGLEQEEVVVVVAVVVLVLVVVVVFFFFVLFGLSWHLLVW